MFSFFRKSADINIFHCCQHKTASQWFNTFLGDSVIQKAASVRRTARAIDLWGREGMPGNDQDGEWVPPEPFPASTIVTCGFLTYALFEKIVKPNPYRGFFVYRDPRDLLLSWYNSVKTTHKPMGRILGIRETLESLSYEEGMILGVKILSKSNYHRALTWLDCADPAMKLYRYEDLFGDDRDGVYADLFEHLQLDISAEQRTTLLAKYSFEKMTKGRKPGQVDNSSHMRRGKPGGWREELPSEVLTQFYELTGTLIDDLGYSRD